MRLDLVSKGKNCVQAAQAAYDAITCQDPNLHQVIVNLESLQEDGKNLAAFSEQAKKTAEATEQQLQAEMNGLSAEKQQIEANVTKLRQDQANAERTLAQQEATLNSDVASIQTMERELVNAEGRLHHARKKRKKKKKGLRKLGGIAGVAFGGLGGGILGSVLGASVAGLAPSDQIERAKAEIARRKAEISSTKKNITATQQIVATIQEQIVKLEANIKENQKRADRLHASIGTTKKSIAFQLKAAHLWDMFTRTAADATGRTEHLKQVVDLAVARENLQILISDGTVTEATSFLEAWEAVLSHGGKIQ